VTIFEPQVIFSSVAATIWEGGLGTGHAGQAQYLKLYAGWLNKASAEVQERLLERWEGLAIAERLGQRWAQYRKFCGSDSQGSTPQFRRSNFVA
jgi:hypothetical protein